MQALRDESMERPSLDERYGILNVLGEGPHGVTYLARSREAPPYAPVAVKILKATRPTREWATQLGGYLGSMAGITHPGIVRVLDAGVDDSGRGYVVTDFIVGRRILDHCLRSRTAVSVRLRLFAEVSATIEAAHRQGLVHGHLVPENILVMAAEHAAIPSIVDFAVNALTGAPSCEPGQDLRALAGLLGQLLPPVAGDGNAGWSSCHARITQAISDCKTAGAIAEAAKALTIEQRP
jgi:eukaryotic-like serine/threonine-protein kinase